MNKIFKIVFNAARGKMMVVNEATSSVQTGKKAAVTVAVATALMVGSVSANADELNLVGAGLTIQGDQSYSLNVAKPATPVASPDQYYVSKKTVGQSFADAKADKSVDTTFEGNVTISQENASGRNTTGTGSAFGLSFFSGSLTFEKNAEIDVASTNADGINATGIQVWGYEQGAYDLESVLTFKGDKLVVKASNANTRSGDAEESESTVTGIELVQKGSLVVSEKTVVDVTSTATGIANAYGLNHAGGGVSAFGAEFGGDATFTVSAKDGNAYGVALNTQGYTATTDAFKGEAKATFSGNTKITASSTSGNARGLYVTNGSSATLGKDKDDVIDIDVQAGKVGYGIIATQKNNKVNVNADQLLIDVTAADATGIIVTNNVLNVTDEEKSRIDIDANTITINVSGQGERNGISAMAKGIVSVEGDLTINAEHALLARGEAQILVNQSGKHDVKLNGNIAFDYHAPTSGTAVDADVNVKLVGSNSFLKGNILVTGENIPAGFEKVSNMTLSLADGATWTSTADSFVNTLEMNQNGIVAIGENTVEVKDVLKGDSGTVVLGADTSKFVVAEKATDELGMLTVKKAGATADTMTAEDAQALLENVTGVTNVQAVVDEGQVVGEIVVGADGTVEEAVNSKTEALADKVALAPEMITRIMMNDVRKRMGDLRAAEGTHGVWARYNGGQMSGAGVDADFHMVQVGIDTVPVVDAPRFGVAFSYAQAEAKDNFGTTDMDSFSLAFYGTKMYDNGMFVDVIGRMATMDSDIVNAGAKGKMDNVALSLSGELGWRFDVTDRFFFEPSVEATYTYTNADTFTMTNGGTYELEAVDSLVGRAGFAAGFKCPANKGDIYVRAAVVHEFMGDMTVNSSINGIAAASLEADGKDTWFEYAIGANFNVNKNTYVYADIERTEGAAMDEDWRANVGVRFAF